MLLMTNSRYIRVLLLVLFACSSLASPNLFVLCNGDGGTGGIVPFHTAHSACAVEQDHQCGYDGGSAAGIVHNHARCTDFGLSGHLGLVKERERLLGLPCLWSSASLASNIDLWDKERIGRQAYPAPVRDPSHHFPDPELESVVLII
jgi:hypothetical protein